MVLLSGSAIAVNWADENVDAIIQAWYPGAQGGRAVAELLFGQYSPSGRLPVTFYKTTEELPDFRDYSMKNRTYRYMQNEALYPFGFGLSYTTFKYSNLKLSSNIVNSTDNVTCTVTVENSGGYEGKEVIQLYIRDVEASVDVPKWQLRGIQVENFLPGEIKDISFIITPSDLSLINNDGEEVFEKGEFEIFVGGSQPDSRSVSLLGVAPCIAKIVTN